MRRFFLGVALVVGLAACGGAQEKSLWGYYDGCDEAQCTSWANACEADCANKGGALTECQNQCQTKREECNKTCTKKPGAETQSGTETAPDAGTETAPQ